MAANGPFTYRPAFTPPVVCDGRLYVAIQDRHLSASRWMPTRPARLWQFTAGGPIDSPPTIHGDLVAPGCTDGYLPTACEPADGALFGGFAPPPSQRQIIAHGHLESPWRVHGSVLVKNGVAYLTAGRS